VPTPGPQNGRYASEPLGGLTSLTEYDSGKTQFNASAQLATDIGDTVKRIDGTEVPLLAPWQGKAANTGKKPVAAKAPAAASKAAPAPKAKSAAKPAVDKTADAEKSGSGAQATASGKKPRTMKAPRKAGADDLKLIKGIGPKLEATVNAMGFFHFDQIAKWGQDELAWVDENLEGFKGRASRDNWVEQAGRLARGGETEFSARATKDGRYD
jgi:NADH-quinone oxidoreductase subunit E